MSTPRRAQRFLRGSLLLATLSAAAAWLYVLASTARQLHELLEDADNAAAIPNTRAARAPTPPRATPGRAAAIARADAEATGLAEAAHDDEIAPPRSATAELSAAQIMRLIADELATETDPNAADELLHAFRESLEAPQ